MKFNFFSGTQYHGGAKPNLTVVSKEFRYIVTYKDESLQKVLFKELYHQKQDFDEMNNLINNSSYKSVINEMQKLVYNHKKEVLKY